MNPGRTLWTVWAAAAVSAGCAGATPTATPTSPTLVAVSPDDFLGNVPCADAPGAMRIYVATVYDVTPGLGPDGSASSGFALPSSGPVSCLQEVGFGGGFVIAGHQYVADIAGYDRTDLRALGGASSGSPILVDTQTGAYVPPRWTTSCGRGSTPGEGVPVEAGALDGSADARDAAPGDGSTTDASRADSGTPRRDAGSQASASPLSPESLPAVAASYRTIFVRGCAPLTAHQAPGPTGITVALDSTTLGSLTCGSGAGQVANFTATLQGSTSAPKSAACGDKVEFSGLVPGQSYDFDVEAFPNGETTPHWATHCYGRALEGAVTAAQCDSLTDRGAISVDIPALLPRLGLSCGGNLLAVTVTLAGAPSVTQTPPNCTAPLRFSDLAPQSYTIAVTTTLAGGAAGKTASCTATVLPARVVQALCTVD